MKGLFKKGRTLINEGVEPVSEGIINMETGAMEIEAKERAKVCGDCDKNVKEPISWLRVNDEANESISGRMCDGCGCELPLLVRQNKKICKHWKE